MTFEKFKQNISELDISALGGNPITITINDFDEEIDFTKAMFFAGSHFKGEDEIVVRYSKPFVDDDVLVQFQILKSKAKLFLNYLKNNELKIVCVLSGNKEIKESIKFFNSIGVKGEDMVPLLSKEYDYVAMLKEGLEEFNKYKEMMGEKPCNNIKVTISVERDKDSEINYPMLSYEFIMGDAYSNFSDTKTWIKREILKIEE